ncbi:hypothetical protein LTS18_001075 [Coniosporium uncinatum]|uniref:Uncharacterized protein n=1 Tax=Coniosporium uncinatum TaxID=93489 RepID=A0ACC3DD80_9PEZI|nr:hypothetical protein LTS18_001075 [Coniosporium uncinatum]
MSDPQRGSTRIPDASKTPELAEPEGSKKPLTPCEKIKKRLRDEPNLRIGSLLGYGVNLLNEVMDGKIVDARQEENSRRSLEEMARKDVSHMPNDAPSLQSYHNDMEPYMELTTMDRAMLDDLIRRYSGRAVGLNKHVLANDLIGIHGLPNRLKQTADALRDAATNHATVIDRVRAARNGLGRKRVAEQDERLRIQLRKGMEAEKKEQEKVDSEKMRRETAEREQARIRAEQIEAATGGGVLELLFSGRGDDTKDGPDNGGGQE